MIDTTGEIIFAILVVWAVVRLSIAWAGRLARDLREEDWKKNR